MTKSKYLSHLQSSVSTLLEQTFGYDFNEMLVYCITLKSCIFENNNVHSICPLLPLLSRTTRAMAFQKQELVVMELALRMRGISLAKGSRKTRLLRKQTKNKEIFVILLLSNRLQVSMVYRLINHAGCW